MNIKKNGKVVSLFSIVLFLGCAGLELEQESKGEQLHKISKVYKALVPYIYNEGEFSDAKNNKFILTKITEIDYRLDSLSQKDYPQNRIQDPAVLSGIEKMRTSIKESLDSFYVQSYGYSLSQLKDSLMHFVKVSSFIANNKDHGNEGVFIDRFDEVPKLKQSNVGNLIELANLQMATRDYLNALETLNLSLDDKKLSNKQKEETLHLMMVISIKNLQSLPIAKKIINDLKLRTNLASYKPKLVSWDRYLSNVLEQSKASIVEKAIANPSLDGSNFVESLHKSAILHESLKSDLDQRTKARLLYSLGSFYVQNKKLGYENLPTKYFESCIKVFPHSRISEKCYYSLENEVRKSYDIGMSDQLPIKEKQKLAGLKYLTRIYFTKRVGSISNVLEY